MGTNGDLHADFQLSAGGEQIGLFAPDGTPQSTVTFTAQFQNVSQGRFPDGDTNTLVFMTNFTPRVANRLDRVVPQIASLSASSEGVISFTFNITPWKTYRIDSKTDLGLPDWTLGPEQVAQTSTVTVTASTGAGTQRFYRVVLLN